MPASFTVAVSTEVEASFITTYGAFASFSGHRGTVRFLYPAASTAARKSALSDSKTRLTDLTVAPSSGVTTAFRFSVHLPSSSSYIDPEMVYPCAMSLPSSVTTGDPSSEISSSGIVSSAKAYSRITSTSIFWSYTQFSTVIWNCTFPSLAFSTLMVILRHCPALQLVISFDQLTVTYSGVASPGALLYWPDNRIFSVFAVSTAVK